MAKSELIKEKTPNGGDYSEIFYFNDAGENVDEKEASRCVIRECKNDGSLINEIWGEIDKD